MNNKGFTLIELLVSIGLIATISTVIVVNMTSNQTKEKSQEYENFKTKIETAACTYIDEYQNSAIRDNCKTSGCKVSLKEIVQDGLIDSDLVDPSTKTKVYYKDGTEEVFAKIHVDIAWTVNNGYKEKTCTFQDGEVSDLAHNT